MNETWAPIIGFPRYEVSDAGRVRSRDHELVRRSRWGFEVTFKRQGQILKPLPGPCGYQQVQLGAGGTNRKYVHRLVATAFCGSGGAEVNHLNGNKADNRSDNLAWCSHMENQRHAVRVLGHKGGQFGPGRVRYAAGAR